jgi:hypothetical protein
MIALLIGYESISRFFAPVPIRFAEAIPIAVLGLAVNVGSVWLLSGGGHHHHGHSHDHDDNGHDHDEEHTIETPDGVLALIVFEDGVPPVFRLRPPGGRSLETTSVAIETVRPGGVRQIAVAGWKASNQFPSRISLQRSCASPAANIPSCSRNTRITSTARRTGTTTCALPSSTCWRMPQCRFWSSPGC